MGRHQGQEIGQSHQVLPKLQPVVDDDDHQLPPVQGDESTLPLHHHRIDPAFYCFSWLHGVRDCAVLFFPDAHPDVAWTSQPRIIGSILWNFGFLFGGKSEGKEERIIRLTNS